MNVVVLKIILIIVMGVVGFVSGVLPIKVSFGILEWMHLTFDMNDN